MQATQTLLTNNYSIQLFIRSFVRSFIHSSIGNLHMHANKCAYIDTCVKTHENKHTNAHKYILPLLHGLSVCRCPMPSSPPFSTCRDPAPSCGFLLCTIR